ncbi:hypothetical protein ABW21_db0204516 [Orbilia brochopaga]|nr:hypothetical protein ABW21_db0204516 [Drechslerella brochopaga]
MNVSSDSDTRICLRGLSELLESQKRDDQTKAGFLGEKMKSLSDALPTDWKETIEIFCDRILSYGTEDDENFDHDAIRRLSLGISKLEMAILITQLQQEYTINIEKKSASYMKEVHEFLAAYETENQSAIIISPRGRWALYDLKEFGYKDITDEAIVAILENKPVLRKLEGIARDKISRHFKRVEGKLRLEHYAKKLDLTDAGGDASQFLQYEEDEEDDEELNAGDDDNESSKENISPH